MTNLPSKVSVSFSSKEPMRHPGQRVLEAIPPTLSTEFAPRTSRSSYLKTYFPSIRLYKKRVKPNIKMQRAGSAITELSF
jgi:hypothetical protein